jgi:hypothetical protein
VRRSTLAVAVALALGCVPLGAHAATTPKSCKLVTDPAGDDYVNRNAATAGAPSPVHDKSLDLLGGDIASNAKAVTVVFRVAKLSRPPATSGQGERFYALLTPTTAEEQFYVEGDVTAASASYYAGYIGEDLTATQLRPQLGAATAAFDTKKNEVRITAPLSLFAKRGAKFTKKTKWTATEFYTGRMGAPGNPVTGAAVAPFSDDALATKGYLHMSPSCVLVGK